MTSELVPWEPPRGASAAALLFCCSAPLLLAALLSCLLLCSMNEEPWDPARALGADFLGNQAQSCQLAKTSHHHENFHSDPASGKTRAGIDFQDDLLLSHLFLESQ